MELHRLQNHKYSSSVETKTYAHRCITKTETVIQYYSEPSNSSTVLTLTYVFLSLNNRIPDMTPVS